MPKKTRKNKFLAEARRKKQAEQLISYKFVKPQSTDTKNITSQDQKENVSKNKSIAVESQTSLATTDSVGLKKDLLKIILFTIFAIIFQIVIYYFHRG